jgi:arsenite methyltransferase
VNDGSGADKWAAWVLARSHAGDAAQKRRSLRYLEPIRDQVLSNADVGAGDTVLDVGAGDGLIGFGAIPVVGASGRVIFSDVSRDLLEHCRKTAEELDVADRCRFVEASADDLSPVEDDSADVVTTRSVLIYVDAKDRAFREFHRVLRPGRRLSIFEPINRYFPEDPNEFWGFDATPVRDLVEKISASERSDVEGDEDDPMMNFDEGDLLRHAESAGFNEVHVELKIDVVPGSWAEDWERLLGMAPNPNAQTVGETIQSALTREETQRFEEHLRPLADSARGLKRSAFAYLWAVK